MGLFDQIKDYAKRAAQYSVEQMKLLAENDTLIEKLIAMSPEQAAAAMWARLNSIEPI